MNRRISKDLAYFLKKNGIYTNFLRYNRDNRIDEFLTLRSFNWTDTTEGYVFWMNINCEYSTYLAKKITETMVKDLNKKYSFN